MTIFSFYGDNKPKGLKVVKEVLMLIGSMIDRLDD